MCAEIVSELNMLCFYPLILLYALFLVWVLFDPYQSGITAKFLHIKA